MSYILFEAVAFASLTVRADNSARVPRSSEGSWCQLFSSSWLQLCTHNLARSIAAAVGQRI